MAKNVRKGVKTYRPHCLGVFIYALFALGVLAGLAAFVIFPMFTFKVGEDSPIVFKGLDFVLYTVRDYFSGFAKPEFTTFSQYFTSASPTNQILKIICQFHSIIELVIAGLFVLVALFAVIEALLTLFFILLGQSKHPKSLEVFAWLIFWFFAVAIGLSYMYFFFYQQIIGGTGQTASITLAFEVLYVLGGMFVLCILLLIVFKIKFKNRVAFKNKKKKDEDAVVIEDNAQAVSTPIPAPVSQPAPAPQVAPAPVAPIPAPEPTPEPVVVDELAPTPAPAPSVITIGDRAYAKNVELKVSNIPEGIVSLGSSAFASCLNLESVSLPSTLKEIGFNCFFNTPKLTSITFNGTLDQWKTIKRGMNWLTKSGTRTVKCLNGQVNVNPQR